MRAWMNTGFGGPDRLRLVDAPVPTPLAREVRLRVLFAGVNHVDWQLREGYFRDAQTYRFPFVPGWDVAGVVEALGPETDGCGLGEGDVVFAYCRDDDLSRHGSYAEYVTVAAGSCALVPPWLEPHHAAVMPVASLTALQVLDLARVQPAERVWLAGAAGSVGRLVLGIFAARGVPVTAVARLDRAPELLALGASSVVDPLARPGSHAEVIVDCGLSPGLDQLREWLVPGGRLVTIAQPPAPEASQRAGIQVTHLFSRPDGHRLVEAAGLLRDGTWPTPRVDVAALTAAPELQRRMKEGHRGKLCLRISAPSSPECAA
jgi:NADPH:quinone reductase-like Zn-dependent oxidoreductase